MRRLATKTAVVTGAGSGIGEAIALLFAAEGARVACLDLNAAAAEATAREVQALGHDAFALAVDVALPASVEAACDAVLARWGDPHVLINNAGFGVAGSADALSYEQWQRGIDVNLGGAFCVSKAFWPGFLRIGGGVIVNNSSVMGLGGDQNAAAYVAAKAGLVGLTKSLAADGAHLGIRANCVCPGFVDTPPMRAVFDPSSGYTGTREQLERHVPMRRFATSREVANAFLFLASDESSYVTGTTLVVDGGAMLGYQGSDV